MKIHLKKLISSLACAFMLFSVSSAHAQDSLCCDTNGNGYRCMRNAPCLAPAIALGTAAIIAIIAIAVQNSGHGHGHHHHH